MEFRSRHGQTKNMRTSRANTSSDPTTRNALAAPNVAPIEYCNNDLYHRRQKSRMLQPKSHPSSFSFYILTAIVFVFAFDGNYPNTHARAAAAEATPVCDPPCENDGICTPRSLALDLENRIRRRTESNDELGVCVCTEGFGGPSCKEVCTLRCYNGGTCNPYLQVGGLTSCDCPKGYEGRQCDIDVCDNGRTSCLNGSKCIKRGNFNYVCDCSSAHGHSAYAGPQCEYEATTFCALDGSPSNTHFCVNGGKCVAKVSENERHEGCRCTNGYTGEHCQYLMEEPLPERPRPKPPRPRVHSKVDSASPITGNRSGNIASIMFLVAFIVSVTAVMACSCVTIYTSWKMRQNNDAFRDLNLWGLDSGILEDLANESSSTRTDALSVDLTDDGTNNEDDASNKDEEDDDATLKRRGRQ